LRANDVGPQARTVAPCVPAQPAHAGRAAGGRSPLGAPPRRFFGIRGRRKHPKALRLSNIMRAPRVRS